MSASPLIFEQSRPGRRNPAQAPAQSLEAEDIPAELLREEAPALPEVSEMQAVRHYTRLSQRNFAIDTQFYPLGSCTMKYNPRVCNTLAMLPQFLARHPLAPAATGQGFLACLFELQEMLKTVTGMRGVSLAPMAGAQGEFAGIAMIRAYHDARGDHERREILVPDAAHGTNPASAVMCGYTAREIPTDAQGDVDLEALREVVGPETAGLMLTNPSTLGAFERRIADIARLVHEAGGLLYYDGANLNAILGKVRPGDMGFDVIHLNLHKTFSTPHGGGGPGSGPVGVSGRLADFLPGPVVAIVEEREDTRDEDGPVYDYVTPPRSIGRMKAFHGQFGMHVRAYAYIRMQGKAGMRAIADYAVLNANYLLSKLRGTYKVPFDRTCMHEFVVEGRWPDAPDVHALDVSKRLMDHGFHPPTNYFPLIVPEALMIEPTETESKEMLDNFARALLQIAGEAHTNPEALKTAPHTTPVARLDEVRAARELMLCCRPVPEWMEI